MCLKFYNFYFWNSHDNLVDPIRNEVFKSLGPVLGHRIDLFILKNWPAWKRPETPNRKRQHKVIFLHGNTSSHTVKRVCDTSEVLSWEVPHYAAYSTDLTSSDYHLFASMISRTCWAAFWFVRRCEKMVRWMVRSKGGRFLPAWYSQSARKKMGKMYNKRWSILWIKHCYHSSEFNVFFRGKKSAFHTCTPGNQSKKR